MLGRTKLTTGSLIALNFSPPYVGFCSYKELTVTAIRTLQSRTIVARSKRIFGNRQLSSYEADFSIQRRRCAAKLANPRLLEIYFHTRRYWEATMEYHKTKDILHVMKLLGHRNVQNTMSYTELANLNQTNTTEQPQKA